LRDGATLAQALGDGEDYELLATIRPGTNPPAPFVEIGAITAAGALLDGVPLERLGYEHGNE
jgi:thiamine monophosphate kinase